MSADDDKPPYDVGYGKPPIEHRFAKGKSGNPGGRLSKPARSLTRRQLLTDSIKIAEKLVKVKRNGKTAMVPLIEVILESAATKAANGHGPSQRFFIKQYTQSIEQLNKSNSKVLGLVGRFEDDAMNAPQGEISAAQHEQLNHLRRRSHQVIGQYDIKKDPYIKKQLRQSAATIARYEDRTSRGILPAVVEVLEAGLRVSDPSDGRQLLIDRVHQWSLHRMLGACGKISLADLAIGLSLGGSSYDEITDQLRQSDIPFEEGVEP